MPAARHFVLHYHPSETSYTRHVARQWCAALAQAGDVVTEHRPEEVPLSFGWDEYLASGAPGATDPAIAGVQAELARCATLSMVCPLWWVGFPGAVKAWIDRVLSPGFAYRMDGERAIGLLGHLHVAMVLTMGTDEEVYEADGSRAAMETLWRRHLCEFSGMSLVGIAWLGNARLAGDEARARHTARVRALAHDLRLRCAGSTPA